MEDGLFLLFFFGMPLRDQGAKLLDEKGRGAKL